MRMWQVALCCAVLVLPTVSGRARQAPRPSTALERLVAAIDADDINAVRKVLKENPELEPACEPDAICKPLALAAGRGNLDIVTALIEAGADPNGKNAHGDTAFITADHASTLVGRSSEEIRQIRRYLIQHGTDVNQPNAFGMTPFIGLCASGDLELAQLALEHGADVNAAFNSSVTSNSPGPVPGGNSALIWAASAGHQKIVSFLIEHGADVDHSNNEGKTASDAAREAGHSEIVTLLTTVSQSRTTPQD